MIALGWLGSLDGGALMLGVIWDWPITVWVILLAVVVCVGEYLLLLIRKRGSRPLEESAEKRLSLVATALRNYADKNGNRLPEALSEVDLTDIKNIAYRPAPRINFDEKLMLIHDSAPTHKIIEFPALRDGRGLVFCNGRMHIVTEEVFDKLLFADDALRERLGLEPIANVTVQSSATERRRDAGRD